MTQIFASWLDLIDVEVFCCQNNTAVQDVEVIKHSLQCAHTHIRERPLQCSVSALLTQNGTAHKLTHSCLPILTRPCLIFPLLASWIIMCLIHLHLRAMVSSAHLINHRLRAYRCASKYGRRLLHQEVCAANELCLDGAPSLPSGYLTDVCACMSVKHMHML